MKFRFFVFAAALFLTTGLSAQKYPGGLVDKTVAVVGNEVILVSDIESAVQQEQAQGRSSDREHGGRRTVQPHRPVPHLPGR